ncbi:hypothetical protein FQN54_009736 [Arachnomyces sp. PD_36]|nr:hypothetical protein FQN54_009736 [Arachnomyces sp. PD_36]
MDTSRGAEQRRNGPGNQAQDKRDRKPAGTSRATEKKALTPPIDLSSLYSVATKHRDASKVKLLYKRLPVSGLSNLASGLPHECSFPFDTFEAKVALPSRFKPTPNEPYPEGCLEYDTLDDAPTVVPTSGKLTVPKESDNTNKRKKIDLATALGRSDGEGYLPLVSFLRQFTQRNLHPNVPYAGGPEIVLTCGNTDGFAKTIEVLTNPWNEDRDWEREREGMLCESFAYPNAIQAAAPRGLNIVPVRMDEQGMVVLGHGGLADVLDNWDYSRGKRPHILYTVTIGQNPTGATLSVERRRSIYTLCCQYNIVIVEDEPYWHLQYPSAERLAAQYKGNKPTATTQGHAQNYNSDGKSSGFEFLDSLVPSYLSIDSQGRVVCLDTFSHSIAPGSRLGWLTAQPRIVEQILHLTETTTQQPSGFSQSMIAGLIMGPQTGANEDPRSKVHTSWRVDGWVRWLEGLRGDYERRMQTMCTILEENKFILLEAVEQKQKKQHSSHRTFGFGSGSSDIVGGEWELVHKVQMFDFSWPQAGLFVWLHLRLDTHPLHHLVEEKKLAGALWKHLIKKPYLCVVSPGAWFSSTKEITEQSSAWSYFRVSFASMDASDVGDVSRALVEGFRTFWKKSALAELRDVEYYDDDDYGYVF